MAPKSKALFNANSIISTIIISTVLVSIRSEVEALVIPSNSQADKLAKLEAVNQNAFSHNAYDLNRHYEPSLEERHELLDASPGEESFFDSRYSTIKRAWQSLQNPWGKRTVANPFGVPNSDRLDGYLVPAGDVGNSDDYIDLLLIPNKPSYANTEPLDLFGQVAATTDADASLVTTLNGHKRAWKNFNGVWGKRVNGRNGSNQQNGFWGKREPAWNNLKGLWGKRSWTNFNQGWGKRDEPIAPNSDKQNYY